MTTGILLLERAPKEVTYNDGIVASGWRESAAISGGPNRWVLFLGSLVS